MTIMGPHRDKDVCKISNAKQMAQPVAALALAAPQRERVLNGRRLSSLCGRIHDGLCLCSRRQDAALEGTALFLCGTCCLNRSYTGHSGISKMLSVARAAYDVPPGDTDLIC